MAYTTINKSTDHVNTKLYTGNNSTNAITGVGHQPDMVWIKRRNNTSDHQVYDAVRGAQKGIFTSTTGAEATEGSTRGLNAFNSDGFTLGAEVSDIAGSCNANSDTYASWNWKAGTTSGLSGGTITPSAYSINTTSKFGIYKYSGTGANATLAHGLGATPSLVMTKSLGDTSPWAVWCKGLANTEYLVLNDSAGKGTGASNMWNSTSPTDTLISFGSDGQTNGSGKTFICYVWCDVAGYCKAGSYTGNGNADGTFIYTGFKPAWIMIKRTGSAQSWVMFDNKRNPFNLTDNILFAHLNNAEQVDTTPNIDIVSNGWKIRHTDDSINGSETYIYMAFGQSLVGSNNIPCSAR